MLTTIQDAVKLLLPAKRKAGTSGWVSFNAPCCVYQGESADTRNRGGVKTNTDGSVSYHCFNCHFKASYQPGRHLTFNFRKLLGWLGADEGLVRKLVIDAVRIKDLINPEELKKVEPEEEVTFKVRPLPVEAKTIMSLAEFYRLSDFNNVPMELTESINYLMSRKINVGKYDFYWTPESEHNYHKRVIVPCYWKGELIGSTARTFDQEVKPKYYSDYEPNYVFNIDNQKPDSQFVIAMEGPFDAMAVDGIGFLGSECSDVQADIVDSLGKEVIVVPDFDVKIVRGKSVWAGVSLVDQAIEYGWSVSFPIWREEVKDVSAAVEKYGKLFVMKSIIEGKQTSRLKIELMKKRIHNK